MYSDLQTAEIEDDVEATFRMKAAESDVSTKPNLALAPTEKPN